MAQADSINITTRRTLLKGLGAYPVVAGALVGGTAIAGTAITNAAETPDDSVLVRLEKQIFEADEVEKENDGEIYRLYAIWDPELRRLQAEVEAGTLAMTREEIWTRVGQMPEAQEHNRLCMLQHANFCKKYQLLQEMDATPARTPEGRRAKLLVLLNFYVEDDWRNRDDDVYDGNIVAVATCLLSSSAGSPQRSFTLSSRDQ
jgi:hypothetical protein